MLRLVLSSKRNKLLLLLFFAIAGALIFWSVSQRVADPAGNEVAEVDAPTALGLVVPANDAAIYRTLEAYVAALIADDRPAVLALLTAAHQETFGENSFLLQPGAKEQYSEISLAALDHSFPTYTSQFPGLEGQTVAVIALEYTVNFLREGEPAERPRFREELVLRQEGERWLIVGSQRDFLRLEEEATP